MTTTRRLSLAYLALTVGVAVLFALNLFWGSVSLTPGAVAAALLGRDEDALAVGIVLQLRLPRAAIVDEAVNCFLPSRLQATSCRPSSPTPSPAPSSWACPAAQSWQWP